MRSRSHCRAASRAAASPQPIDAADARLGRPRSPRLIQLDARLVRSSDAPSATDLAADARLVRQRSRRLSQLDARPIDSGGRPAQPISLPTRASGLVRQRRRSRSRYRRAPQRSPHLISLPTRASGPRAAASPQPITIPDAPLSVRRI
jgi:hypothetical protein